MRLFLPRRVLQSFFAAAKKEIKSCFPGTCASENTLCAERVCERSECANEAKPLNEKPNEVGFR